MDRALDEANITAREVQSKDRNKTLLFANQIFQTRYVIFTTFGNLKTKRTFRESES